MFTRATGRAPWFSQPWRRVSYPHWDTTVTRAHEHAISGGWWAPGRHTKTFERKLAERLGVDPACVVATTSCTAALAAATFACGWQNDPGVAAPTPQQQAVQAPRCPVLTYPGTYSSLRPRERQLVDVDGLGWPGEPVEIGVDLWGRLYPKPCVVRDAAHRFADPRALECTTEFICYSFGPGKEAPCPNGGALVAQTPARVDAVRSFLDNGRPCGDFAAGVGVKGLMPDPTAIMLLRQLPRLERIVPRRQEILRVYTNALGDGRGGLKGMLTVPDEASGHLAVFLAENAEHGAAVRRRLKKKGVQSFCHYPVADREAFPHAAVLADRLISLPCHQKVDRPLTIAEYVATA